MNQSNLLKNLKELNDKSRTRTKESKNENKNTFESVNTLYEGEELSLNTFKSEIFPIK